jgi:hypothetical protein
MNKQQHDHRNKKPEFEFLTGEKIYGNRHACCFCTLNVVNNLSVDVKE